MKQPKQIIDTERKQTSIWLMGDDLTRADALVAKLGRDRTALSAGKITRSTVLRLAVARGLDALEKEYK